MKSRSASRGVSLFVFWGVWIILNCAPLIIITPPKNFYVGASSIDVLLALVFELSLLSVEVAVIVMAALMMKQLLRHPTSVVRWAALPPFICLTATLWGWCLLLVASWYLYGTTQTFVDRVHVRMLLAPFGGEHTLVIEQDWKKLWICCSVAAVLTAAIVVLLSRPSFRPRFATAGLLLATGLAGTFASRGPLAAVALPSERREGFQSFVSHFTAADATLLLSYFGHRRTVSIPVDVGALRVRFDPQSLSPAQRRRSAPNIILLVVEALRADVLDNPDASQMYPNIARVMNRGCLFSRVFAQSNESNYSFVALLSGTYALTEEFRDDFTHGHHRVLLGDLLSRLGYQTAVFMGGDDHWQNLRDVLSSPLLDLYFVGETGDPDERRALLAARDRPLRSLDARDVAWIERFRRWVAQRDRTRPFFAFGAFIESHFPYNASHGGAKPFPETELSREEAASLSFLGYPPELRARMKLRYLTTLMDVDEMIGELWDTLARAGLADSTVLLITGDHGELFGEHDQVNHAGELWDPSLRVPLVISDRRWCQIPRDTPLQLIDVAPTILDAATEEPVPGFQGDSILSSARVPATRPLFSTVQSVADQDAVIAWPWKIIDDHRTGRMRFFDLANDPDELRAVAQTAHPELQCLGDMLRRYRSWQIGYYDDPSLTEKFSPPHYDFDAACAAILSDSRHP